MLKCHFLQPALQIHESIPQGDFTAVPVFTGTSTWAECSHFTIVTSLMMPQYIIRMLRNSLSIQDWENKTLHYYIIHREQNVIL